MDQSKKVPPRGQTQTKGEDTLSRFELEDTKELGEESIECALNEEASEVMAEEDHTVVLNRKNLTSSSREDLTIEDLEFLVDFTREETPAKVEKEVQKEIQEEIQGSEIGEISLGKIEVDAQELSASQPLQEMVIETYSAPSKTDVASVLSQEIERRDAVHIEELVNPTVLDLQEERKRILKNLQELETDLFTKKSRILQLEKMVEEARAEQALSERRYTQEIENLKNENKKKIMQKESWQIKETQMKQDFSLLEQRVREDIRRIQMHERELSEKLEMVQIDAKSQIEHRDHRILELKRKIDSLDFEREMVLSSEKKEREEKEILQERFDTLLRNLKMTINEIEQEESPLYLVKKSV
ncbi:MAG: hypothetical protein KBD63_07465 [Bacteriovoracaceae bacterium]|nr:hypothetical protein [Bacteriovoracaceae bacterium]